MRSSKRLLAEALRGEVERWMHEDAHRSIDFHGYDGGCEFSQDLGFSDVNARHTTGVGETPCAGRRTCRSRCVPRVYTIPEARSPQCCGKGARPRRSRYRHPLGTPDPSEERTSGHGVVSVGCLGARPRCSLRPHRRAPPVAVVRLHCVTGAYRCHQLSHYCLVQRARWVCWRRFLAPLLQVPPGTDGEHGLLR